MNEVRRFPLKQTSTAHINRELPVVSIETNVDTYMEESLHQESQQP